MTDILASKEEVNPFDSKVATQTDAEDNPFSERQPDEDPNKKVDMSGFKEAFEAHIQAEAEKLASKETGQIKPPPTDKKYAESYLEAFQSGWQVSFSGLLKRQQLPDTVLPENAEMGYRIASMAGTLAGDLPAILGGLQTGAALGGSAGTLAGAGVGALAGGAGAIPGAMIGGSVGASLGAGAASMALPAAFRKILMEKYEKGEVKTWQDFYERGSAVAIESLKEGSIGATTFGLGSIAGRSFSVLGPRASQMARMGAEVATMTTMGAAMHGKAPDLQEFTDAAMFLGIVHALPATAKASVSIPRNAAKKLMEIYEKTGVRPAQVIEEAMKDPSLHQELLTDGNSMPERFEAVSEKIPEKKAEVKPEEVKTIFSEKGSSTKDFINSKIVDKPEKPASSFSASKLYQDFVDKFHPLKKISEEGYKEARMVNDHKGLVAHVIEHGPLEFEGHAAGKGKGLKQILEPIKNNYEDFKAYLVAKRALELEDSGRKSGFIEEGKSSYEDLRALVKEGDKHFKTASEEFLDLNNKNLKYLKDSGVLGEEAFNAMVEASKAYVSFKRVIEKEGIQPGSSGKKGKPSSVKKLEGGISAIQDPIMSFVENAQEIFRIAETNRATSQIVKDGLESGAFEKVKSPAKEIPLLESEIKKLFEEHGIEIGDDPTLEAFSIFRRENPNLKSNEFEVFENGKREVYRADQTVADAIKAMGPSPQAANILLKIAQGVTSVKRTGISLAPAFPVMNAIRDIFTAATASGKGFNVPDVLAAIKDIHTKSPEYQKFLRSGGSQSAFVDFTPDYVSRLTSKSADLNFLDKTVNIVKLIPENMAYAASLIERSVRLAKAKAELKGGASLREAGYAAREVTVDFQRSGLKLQALNSITAFQNVNIQGTDRIIRAIKDDPKGASVKLAAFITTPSVLLWWANKDDFRYKEAAQWEKDTFWLIPIDHWEDPSGPSDGYRLPEYLLKRDPKGKIISINKGPMLRIPKPQGIGLIFGSIPERIMDSAYRQDPGSLDRDLIKSFGSAFVPPTMPDIAAPMVEQALNKNFFRDTKLVPSQLEKIAPVHQYNQYTSETAKALSRLVSPVLGGQHGSFGTSASIASPMVIDNYVSQWTGTLGKYAIGLLDESLRASGAVKSVRGAESKWTEIPVVKSFFSRYPSVAANSVEVFNKNFERAESDYLTRESLIERREFGKLTDFQKSLGKTEMLRLRTAKDAMSRIMMAMNMTNESLKKTPQEKRQLIDGMTYQIISIAERWNKQLSDMRNKELKRDNK